MGGSADAEEVEEDEDEGCVEQVVHGTAGL